MLGRVPLAHVTATDRDTQLAVVQLGFTYCALLGGLTMLVAAIFAPGNVVPLLVFGAWWLLAAQCRR